MRFPVARKIALQIAGAIVGTPGSPTPAGSFSRLPAGIGIILSIDLGMKCVEYTQWLAAEIS